MLFNSIPFAVFFIAVYLLYLNLDHRRQNQLLLAASYVFYGWWDWRFTGLMAFTTLLDFYTSLRIEGASTPRARKAWLLCTITANLCVLGFFKYFNFFIGSAEAALAAAGFQWSGWHLNVILPVGISFYTFQSMSYSIDVYRGDIKASRRLSEFALFVSFFPHLMAGPIVRAAKLLPQFTRPRREISAEDIRVGLYLIAWGLFKKVIVADGCAHLANAVFSGGGEFSGLDKLLGVYAFAFQIYGDFSGYSDMAVGMARLMGIDLSKNFELPYFATSPSDLWRRWHISLSTWLRDYLFIPLGGSRGTVLASYRNLILTMLLGGLWHGASWTMIVWGGYHGIALAAHRMLTGWKKQDVPGAERSPWTALKIVGMFQVTCLGWLLFRAASLTQAAEMLGCILTDLRVTAWTLPAFGQFLQLTWLLIAYETFQFVSKQPMLVLRWRPAFATAFALCAGYCGMLYWMLNRSLFSGAQSFIYFQF